MSVPVSRRRTSSLEYYNTALQLRSAITDWLLRDFGIKSKVRRTDLLCRQVKMDAEDKKDFITIIEKYDLGSCLIDSFPSWWINNRRLCIDNICSALMQNIRAAQNICPTTKTEFIDRRLFQSHAIGNIHQLLEELQYTINVLYKTLGVDVNKYLLTLGVVI